MRNFMLGMSAAVLIATIIIFAFQLGKISVKPALFNTVPTVTITITPSPTLGTTIVPTISINLENDADLIKKALYKKNNWKETEELTITVSKNDGIYANGTVNGSGGGGYFYAVKTNSGWEIVADGNGVILCSAVAKYPEYPKTLISECYDDVTGKIVKR